MKNLVTLIFVSYFLYNSPHINFLIHTQISSHSFFSSTFHLLHPQSSPSITLISSLITFIHTLVLIFFLSAKNKYNKGGTSGYLNPYTKTHRTNTTADSYNITMRPTPTPTPTQQSQTQQSHTYTLVLIISFTFIYFIHIHQHFSPLSITILFLFFFYILFC